MQPTEHKHKDGEELIAHIKHSLKTHEEFYQAGAWEKFNTQQQDKKRPIFWLVRLSAAAAILAICFSLIWFTTNAPKNEQVAKVDTPKDFQSNNETTSTDVPRLASKQLASQSPKSKNSSKELAPLTRTNDSAFSQETILAKNQVAVNNEVIIASATAEVNTNGNTQAEKQEVIAMVDEKPTANTLAFLDSESQKNEVKQDKLAVNKKLKKWDMGLLLAPSFGNTRELNLGYGLSMSYNFSDRLSLTSGIAYNKMSTSKNLPTKIGMSPILMGNVRNLEMISEEVTGIDIPLELKYNINKNVYANLGVSGLAVINQSRNNTFVEEVVVKRTVNATSSIGGAAGSSGGIGSDVLESQKGQFANSYIVNQRTTERASAMEDVNYIGFYNFSIGYTKKVYKHHALSIEPFVKLPIRMVTQDNLRLTSTGVRLRVGF